MAKIHYEADGDIPAERFIAALTDFSERRPELWPNLDTKYFRLIEQGDTWAEVQEGTDVLGGVWGRERYDWSEPGRVTLTLLESPDFKPGTVIDYHVNDRPDGRCHVAVDFQRIAASPRGRFVGAVVQLTGVGRFGKDLRETLSRLALPPG
jgi:hypothetical protein